LCPIKTAFLHYSAPPVTGGVEAVLSAHAQVFLDAGYPVTVIAGQAEEAALPDGVRVVVIPEMGTQHPEILEISAELETGHVPDAFARMRERLVQALRPMLSEFDVVFIHNVFTKHFNLPLTAALFQLIDEGVIGSREERQCVAWCHDLTWTSPNSRSKVFPGYPWDLLRTYRPDVRYIAVSEQRQRELSELLEQPPGTFEVIYNGVEPSVWYGLTPEGRNLVKRLDLLSGDLILLMPVRITQAKNIELAARVVAALKELDCSPRLVVTGPPDPHSEGSLKYFQNLLDLRARLGLERELQFVFNSASDPEDAYLISQQVVSDLLRVSDVLFMPSHREGFGMPVLEAGLIGVPVVAANHIPAAREIGGKNVYLFDAKAAPENIARLILDRATNHPSSRFRRQVRQGFTWERIFQQKIEPLLQNTQIVQDSKL
jgi:mannosylglucosylglycerate synthase